MKCAWSQERLLLYLAEELESAESARAAAYLERCTDCSASLEQLAESRDALREVVRTAAQPSASLDARIMERIQALPRRRFRWTSRLSGWNLQRVLAFSGCALALLLAGYQWGRWNAGRSPLLGTSATTPTHPMFDLAPLTDTHRAWEGHKGPEGADAKMVAASLTRQTGLQITPPDLKDRALRLKDGAVVRMNHIPVALLHYDWNGVSVSLAQADGMRLSPPSSLHEMQDHGNCFLVHQSKGFTYIFWCEGTDTFILVGRVPPSQLFTLACRMCAQRKRG